MRSLWLTPDANNWCFPEGKHPEGIREDLLAIATYQLDSFVRGEELFEGDDLKHLDPHHKEVWEFRSILTHPPSQLRLFGWFPAPNHFVVVFGKRRSNVDFDKAMAKVIEVRQALMADQVLYRGFSYADYIN